MRDSQLQGTTLDICSHATYFIGPMDQYFHEVSSDGDCDSKCHGINLNEDTCSMCSTHRHSWDNLIGLIRSSNHPFQWAHVRPRDAFNGCQNNVPVLTWDDSPLIVHISQLSGFLSSASCGTCIHFPFVC